METEYSTKTDMKQELLTRHEAAQFLRLSVSQLDNIARRGEIKRAKFGKGPRARVLYRLDDLRTYVNAHVD